MGVKGLWSLLEDYSKTNSEIYEDIHFRDSKLVVDGSILAHLLYKMANLNQNHGGEYLAFQAEVQAFFKTLDNCQIKAKVVIDGGSGRSDIKQNHRMDRQRTRVKRIPDALKGGKRDFYALFTMTVFEQTLNNMKVPLVRCFGEADGQLAALAREWSCPGLSRDSDFYIYDLPEGVLPLDQFQWVKTSGARSYISCKRYTMSKFWALFNIDHQLLTVFAALAGNDYDNLRDVKWASYVPAGSPAMKFRDARLVGLLSWLGSRKDEQTEYTLTAAMALVPNISQQARTEMRTEVQNAMLEYRLPSSSLRRFFSEGTVPPLPAETGWSRLYQGRLVHWRQKQLQWRKPEDIVQDDQFRRLYRRLLGVVTQPDPGANRRAGGPEAQLRASMEHLHLKTQNEEEEEEEEELGGAAGLDQGSDGSWVEGRMVHRRQWQFRERKPELRASIEPLHLNTQDEEEEEELEGAEGLDQGSDRPRVSVRTRYRTKDRKDLSSNPELGRKQEREGWL
ncbi:unnamed protein product [Gadus morhua 'NCC']